MDIDTVIAFVAAIGGLAGLVTAITTAIFRVLDYKKAKRGETLDAKLEAHLAPITARLSEIESRDGARDKELRAIRLDTTRTQLVMLMEHQPHNHDTILKVAECYFCTLFGDWYCTSLFQAWADRENIKIPVAIMEAIAANEKNH